MTARRLAHMSKPSICPKCEGAMVQGFVPDFHHHSQNRVGGWHEGPPNKSFWTGIEPFGSAWQWDYYTYWSEMRGSPPRGQTWGNSFVRDDSLKVQKGKWTCVEVMVKMNDVGDSNGEMALWIDGKPISHLGKGFPKGKWVFDKFLKDQGGESVRWNQSKGDRENFSTTAGGEPFEGFCWRTTKDLDVNFVWAYLYITDAPPDARPPPSAASRAPARRRVASTTTSATSSAPLPKTRSSSRSRTVIAATSRAPIPGA